MRINRNPTRRLDTTPGHGKRPRAPTLPPYHRYFCATNGSVDRHVNGPEQGHQNERRAAQDGTEDPYAEIDGADDSNGLGGDFRAYGGALFGEGDVGR